MIVNPAARTFLKDTTAMARSLPVSLVKDSGVVSPQIEGGMISVLEKYASSVAALKIKAFLKMNNIEPLVLNIKKVMNPEVHRLESKIAQDAYTSAVAVPSDPMKLRTEVRRVLRNDDDSQVALRRLRRLIKDDDVKDFIDKIGETPEFKAMLRVDSYEAKKPSQVVAELVDYLIKDPQIESPLDFPKFIQAIKACMKKRSETFNQ